MLQRPIYEFLGSYFSQTIVQNLVELIPIAAKGELAARLEVPSDEPLLCFDEIGYNRDKDVPSAMQVYLQCTYHIGVIGLAGQIGAKQVPCCLVGMLTIQKQLVSKVLVWCQLFAPCGMLADQHLCFPERVAVQTVEKLARRFRLRQELAVLLVSGPWNLSDLS